MKYDVTFTEQAENAAGQLDRIEEKILSFGEYPEKFRQYEREPWKSRNTRVVPVDNYVIFYIPNKTILKDPEMPLDGAKGTKTE